MPIYPAYLLDVKNTEKCPLISDYPPFFFAHTGDDHILAEGSIQIFLELEKPRVKGNELHVYPFGGHGYGMRKASQTVSKWPDRVADWMRALKLIQSYGIWLFYLRNSNILRKVAQKLSFFKFCERKVRLALSIFMAIILNLISKTCFFHFFSCIFLHKTGSSFWSTHSPLLNS